MNPSAGAIVVLSNRRDFAADDVIRRIDHSYLVLRLNFEDVASGPAPIWSLSDDSTKPRAIWWRQFQESRPVLGVEDADELLLQRRQWSAWIETLAGGQVSWMNPPWSARRAENKIFQLRQAARCELLIPPTIVTNDPEEAEAFRQVHGASVVKALSAAYFELSDGGFMFTRSLDDALDLPVSEWLAQPLIVQREIPGTHEARLIVVGREIRAATAARTGLDWRLQSTDWDCCTAVPIRVAEGCLRYMDECGLAYGAFDFVIDDDGWWFLECNQAGEWSWLDREADLGISELLARHLEWLVSQNG